MSTETFKQWLSEKLRALNTDESVFGDYIVGILEDEDTEEEKTEALQGILSEIDAANLTDLVSTILSRWNECQPQAGALAAKPVSIDVNQHLAKLLESQKLTYTSKERILTEEERRIKEQILAQYSETAVEEEDEFNTDETEATTADKESNIERNTNVQDVMQLQKARREQARQDSAAKKQKDKEDREKQRQMREEKKEKRKTVKGERRR